MSTTTILFTDLVNSTELLQRLGDEAAQKILRVHHELLRNAVATNGGKVVKWEGDGVMAAFLSAADAVRCAIAAQQAADRPIAGERLQVRAGLQVGETLAWETTDYFGTPVVVAKRLCQQANPGQILCGDLVVGLLASRRTFSFADVGLLQLKGMAQPVPAFEVLFNRRAPVHRWTEEEAEQYREIAAVAVPRRDEQIAALVTLLPFDQAEPFSVLELGVGEGTIAFAILDCFPEASVVALDGSESMRARAREVLGRFGERATVEPFELASAEWLPRLQSAHAVVSSLLVHHLPDGEKLRLFEAICARLREPGALLIADVVEPQRPEQQMLFADAYDRIAKAQSVARTGSEGLFKRFTEAKWNVFRYGSLPEDEYPSPLFDQLTWLRAAGFEVVDCSWLEAGFAIFGGYKTRAGAGSHGVSLEAALRSAQLALNVATGVS